MTGDGREATAAAREVRKTRRLSGSPVPGSPVPGSPAGSTPCRCSAASTRGHRAPSRRSSSSKVTQAVGTGLRTAQEEARTVLPVPAGALTSVRGTSTPSSSSLRSRGRSTASRGLVGMVSRGSATGRRPVVPPGPGPGVRVTPAPMLLTSAPPDGMRRTRWTDEPPSSSRGRILWELAVRPHCATDVVNPGGLVRRGGPRHHDEGLPRPARVTCRGGCRLKVEGTTRPAHRGGRPGGGEGDRHGP